MSFSSDVKEELAKQVSKSRHCQLAELAGIIELSGRINEKTKGLELDTENLLLLNKICHTYEACLWHRYHKGAG